MKLLITSRFVWPNINKNIKTWSKLCIVCQRNKINRHVFSAIGEFSEVKERFSKIHINIVGPLPEFENYRFVLIDLLGGQKPFLYVIYQLKLLPLLSFLVGYQDLVSQKKL